VSWWKNLDISPRAIGDAQRLGKCRNAFEIRTSASTMFRTRAVAEAKRLGLAGLVEADDNGVRRILEGLAESVDAFFEWCLENAGPGIVPAVIDVTGEDTRPLPLL
jgi:acylphosphatase